jgi:hypothetical protein
MFKVNLMTFKALRGNAPSYIASLIRPYVPNHYDLRSIDHHLLTVPKFVLKSYGFRSFAHQAPILWNALPLNIRAESTLTVFKNMLKTHYFKLAFTNASS